MKLSTIAPWLTSILAVLALVATNAGSISTVLGIAAEKSLTEQQQERLEIFSRKSAILYAGYDVETSELNIIYYIESHPCVDYEVKYVIHGTVIDEASREGSVCEDLPELSIGTHTIRTLEIDPLLMRPHYYTIDGQLIESADVSVLIQWKFKFSDGSFGYNTMTVAVPLETT